MSAVYLRKRNWRVFQWGRWALVVGWGEVVPTPAPAPAVKRRLRHLALLALLGGAAAGCNGQPEPRTLHEWQWRCDQAEAAGLLWMGGQRQDDLRRAAAAGDDAVGWDSGLGCWYVD